MSEFDREAIRYVRSNLEYKKEQALTWPQHNAYVAFLAHYDAMAEALRPFAKAGELFPPRHPDMSDACVYAPAAGHEYDICGDDLRRARAVLSAYASQKERGE